MNVICFGDSNTYGYDPRGYFGGRYDADCRWVDILAAETGWTISNMGQNGREIPVAAPAFPDDTDLLIVMLGSNDLLQGRSPADAARRLGLKRTKHVEVVCGGDYLTTIWKKDYRGSFGWDSLDDLHAEIVQRGFRAVGETFSSIAASREQPDGSIVNYHLTRTKIYT